MLKKIFTSKRGDGYIDMCVGVVVFVMIIVIALNMFEFITLKVEMDQIADDMITFATYNGEFGDDFWDFYMQEIDDHMDFYLDWDADKYFNSTYERVQLGDKMWVEVYYDTYIKGLGIKIPITLTVKKSGLSEKYWK